MAKVARRTKKIVIQLDRSDDAIDFLIAPLTYDQREEQITRALEFREKFPDYPEKTSKDAVSLALANAHFIVCCGLNNADDKLGLTEADVRAQMDDALCSRLIQEIYKLTGLTIPSEEKVQISQQSPGERSASS